MRALRIFVQLFIGLWFFVDKNKKISLLEATGAAVIALIVNQVISLVYFHPRPFMVGLCVPLFHHAPETSFPSDHATLMFTAAFYLILAGKCTAYSIPLLVIAVLTSWGRVYSGIHFPFDMAGSIVVGLVVVGLMRLFTEHLHPLNEKLLHAIDQVLIKKKRKKL